MVRLILVIIDIVVFALLAQILVVFIFVFLVIFAFGAFIIFQLGRETLPPALRLHPAAECLETVALLPPFLQFLVVASPFFRHLEDISIGLVVFSREGKVLFFEPFRLLGHLFHFLAKRQEKIVAIVERIFDLEGIGYHCDETNKQTNKLLRINSENVKGRQAYLLELFDVNVKLASKFCLGV